jgi:hypothetical protein
VTSAKVTLGGRHSVTVQYRRGGMDYYVTFKRDGYKLTQVGQGVRRV